MNIVTDKTFKYNLERLDLNTREFDFIKNFFYLTTDPNESFDTQYDVEGFDIYKVVENGPTKTEEEKSNNLMLFHGTKNKDHATGILKEGFRNSESGYFGKGVYMTECSCTAFDYTGVRLNDVKGTEFLNYVFVNEVSGSEKIQTFTFTIGDALDMDEDNTAELTHPFEKHVKRHSPQPTEEDYKEDMLGRRYRNLEIHGESVLDEFVADAKVTIPRYLIALKTKKN